LLWAQRPGERGGGGKGRKHRELQGWALALAPRPPLKTQQAGFCETSWKNHVPKKE